MQTLDAGHIAPTAQPATLPLHPLWQALLDRLEQPGQTQAGAPPIDFRAFLAALQATAQDAARQSAHRAKEATAPIQANAPPYPPLALVTKPNLTTAELAYYLNRRPQTLRGWACHSGTGPMVPKRIGGLLAWATADAKRIAGVA